MITKQNIAQFFAIIVIATTLSTSTSVYAEKNTIAKVLHNCAAALGGGAGAVFGAYYLCSDADSMGEKAICVALMYLGSTLSYNTYHNLKALRNAGNQADITAKPDAQPIANSKKTTEASKAQ